MNKYKVTCYPTANSCEYDIEADSIEDAIEQAEEFASQNYYFAATEKDVKLIQEDKDEKKSY